MRVFVTGATGFVGRELVRLLSERGDTVCALSRSEARARATLPGEVEICEGDPTEPGQWQENVDGCDAVVHLSGESVAGQRWTDEFRERIRHSRIESTGQIARALSAASNRPAVLISASGIDYYRFAERLADPDAEVDETGPAGASFLAQVCADWEAQAMRATDSGVRVACMRTGLVLGDGGALTEMKRPFQWFAGGRLGSGRQWVPWIHIDDAARAFLHVLDHDDIAGPVNLVAPNPVRNSEFSRELGRSLGRPSWLPAPAFAIRTVLGEFAEYALRGRRAVPRVLERSGFEFRYPELGPALAELARRTRQAR